MRNKNMINARKLDFMLAQLHLVVPSPQSLKHMIFMCLNLVMLDSLWFLEWLRNNLVFVVSFLKNSFSMSQLTIIKVSIFNLSILNCKILNRVQFRPFQSCRASKTEGTTFK